MADVFGMSGQSDDVGIPLVKLEGGFESSDDGGWGLVPTEEALDSIVSGYPLDLPTPKVYGFVAQSTGGGYPQQPAGAGVPGDAIVTNVLFPYDITFSDAGSGKVTWSAGAVTYNGVKYTIAAEGTGDTNKYIYWDLNNTPTTLRTTDTRTTAIGADKFVVCVNDGGTPHPVGTGKPYWGELVTADTLSSITAQIGDVVAGSVTGTVITGGTVRTASTGRRIKMDVDGMKFMTATAGSGKIGTVGNGGDGIVIGTTANGGDNEVIGTGYLVRMYNMVNGVPIYIQSEQTVADHHFFNRSSTPSGAAEVGDVAVVSGVLHGCTAAATPGTWLPYLREYSTGVYRIGGATDYTQFASDGTQTMAGTARVTKYSWITAGAVRGIGGAPATETLNPQGFVILEFADAADDYAQANIKIPDDMDLTADSYICVGWSVPNTSANMTWGYGYLITGPNDDTEAAATTGTQQVTSSSTVDGLTLSPIVTITGGTVGATDVCLQIYIYRDVSADTYGAPVDVHGMALQYTANKIGE